MYIEKFIKNKDILKSLKKNHLVIMVKNLLSNNKMLQVVMSFLNIQQFLIFLKNKKKLLIIKSLFQ